MIEIQEIVVEIWWKMWRVVISQLCNGVHSALEVCTRNLHSIRVVSRVHTTKEGMQGSNIVQNTGFFEANICYSDSFSRCRFFPVKKQNKTVGSAKKWWADYVNRFELRTMNMADLNFLRIVSLYTGVEGSISLGFYNRRNREQW